MYTILYRFSCGRWFARSEDDGSVERLLVAERVPQTIAKSGTMSALSELWKMPCLHALTVCLPYPVTFQMLTVSCHHLLAGEEPAPGGSMKKVSKLILCVQVLLCIFITESS